MGWFIPEFAKLYSVANFSIDQQILIINLQRRIYSESDPVLVVSK